MFTTMISLLDLWLCCDPDCANHSMATDADQDENRERSSGGIIPWEFLTRVELDSAYISEKLLNLEILLLQVENREGDLEGLSLGNEDISVESLLMASEFDILSGIFNSEVKELEKFMAFLQTEVVDTKNRLSRNGCLEESLNEFEEKLHDAQEYLNQSHTQVADMKIQAAKFERMLDFGSDVNDSVKNGRHTSISARWKLQNVEHQRHILQLYEKSLAKELDLEKKLTDSRNNEEAFKLKLRFAESEIYNLEESFEIVMERMFLAENTSEMLLGTSKELLRKFQNAQVNLDDSLHQECVLRSKLHEILKSTEESQFARHTPFSSEHDNILTSPVNDLKINVENTKDECTAASEVIALREKVRSLEEQLKKCEIHSNLTKGPAEESSHQQQKLHCELSEVDDVIKDLRKNVLETEARAENAEAKCELLTKANRELTEELDIVRNYGEEKLNLLEKKLKESDMLLQHAKASFLAIEEQQIMLNSTLIDMGNLIEDLKAKFSKAESRAEIAESKYSLLNETNLVLNEELSFLRGRLECLEASLHDADEAKIVTSRDISIKSKIIAELIMKLAFERERLQIQISELTKKNRYLVIKHLKKKDKDSLCAIEKENHEKTLHFKASVEVLAETSSSEFQADNSGTQVFTNDKMIQNTATPKDEQILVAAPKLDPARSSKRTHLSLKYILGAIAVILVSVLLYLVQLENCE